MPKYIFVRKQPNEVPGAVFNGFMRDIWRTDKQRQRAKAWAQKNPDKALRLVRVSLEARMEKGLDIPAPGSYDDVDEKIDLHAALQKLTAAEQALIDAYYFQDMNEPQISATTGVLQQTINYRRKSAIEKLREYLK